MPPLERTELNQTAVMWPTIGHDRHGQFTRGKPVELSVRWNDVESEVLDPNGNTKAISAIVVLDQAVTIGSQMWLGTKDELRGSGQPRVDVMEVVTVNTTPDINGKEERITAKLMRSKDALAIDGTL